MHRDHVTGIGLVDVADGQAVAAFFDDLPGGVPSSVRIDSISYHPSMPISGLSPHLLAKALLWKSQSHKVPPCGLDEIYADGQKKELGIRDSNPD